MKCHTKLIINLQWNPLQAASIASLHTMALCIMNLLPARLGLEAFSALGREKMQDGLNKELFIAPLESACRSAVQDFQHKMETFSVLSWIGIFWVTLVPLSDEFQKSAPLPALPEGSQFLVLQRSGTEQFLLPVSCRSIQLVPLRATQEGEQVLRVASKHLDIWIGPSQKAPAVGEAMHRRRRLVLKWGNAVWNRI